MTAMGMPPRSRRGFTLIELAAIVLVIGVLAAVSLVAVVQTRARNEQQQAVQSVQAVSAAQFDFADRYGVFTGWPADLDLPDGPEVIVQVSGRPRVVSIAIADDGTVGMAAGSRDGCALRSITSPLEGADVVDRTVDGNEACTGESALPDGSVRAPAASRVPQ